MSDNVSSIFDRFTHSAGGMATAPSAAPRGKSPYQAAMLEGAGTSPTLRVHYSNGNIDVLRYLYLSTISYQERTGSILLVFRTGGVIVQGRGLLPLLDGFERERIARMQAFDPERHFDPKAGEAVIDAIHWRSMRDALQEE